MEVSCRKRARMNDIAESMRTRPNLCIHDLVYIANVRVTSFARNAHSMFVCVGLRGCCLALSDIYRPICAGNTEYWQATFDVSLPMSVGYG